MFPGLPQDKVVGLDPDTCGRPGGSGRPKETSHHGSIIGVCVCVCRRLASVDDQVGQDVLKKYHVKVVW